MDDYPLVTDEQRVQAAAEMGLHLDPVGSGDRAIIIIGACVYGLSLLLLLYCWINISYHPIRAKNIRLTTVTYVAGLLWFIGDLPTNGHVNVVGPWRICKLWAIWGRASSAFIFSSSIMMRAYALDVVFNRGKPYRGWAIYRPLILIATAILAYNITGQTVDAHLTVSFLPSLQVCYYDNAFRISSLAIVWFWWLLVIFFTIRIRNIHSSFNEFQNYIYMIAIVLSFVLGTTILHIVFPKYPLNKVVRIVTTASDIIMCNSSTWIIVAHPVYKCMFDHDGHLDEWYTKLRRDGLQRAYEIESDRMPGANYEECTSTSNLPTDLRAVDHRHWPSHDGGKII